MKLKCGGKNRVYYGVRPEQGLHCKGTDLGAHEARATEEPETVAGPTANIPLGWFLLALICFSCVGTQWLSHQLQKPAESHSLVDLPKFQLDVNSATEAQLAALPDVGKVLAGRIVDYRQQHGPFLQLDDLQRVRGFGTTTLANLRPLLTILPTAESQPAQLAAQK